MGLKAAFIALIVLPVAKALFCTYLYLSNLKDEILSIRDVWP